MTSKQVVNQAAEHFKTLYSATRAELKDMQRTPIGTDERSPQEQAALWRKLRALPGPEFNKAMDIAAEKVGHEAGEEKPCPICQFVAMHAGREGARSK